MSPLLSSDRYTHRGPTTARPPLEQSAGMGSADHPLAGDLPGAGLAFHMPLYLQSRLKKQYSPQQMLAAMADVDAGKPVSKAARAHGVPLRSLYRKLKNRNSGVVTEPGMLPRSAGPDLTMEDDSVDLTLAPN